jgi:hypothetical protein
MLRTKGCWSSARSQPFIRNRKRSLNRNWRDQVSWLKSHWSCGARNQERLCWRKPAENCRKSKPKNWRGTGISYITLNSFNNAQLRPYKDRGYVSVLWGHSRYSDCLQAGRQRGWSSGPGRVKNFHFSISSRPALGFTQPLIQRVSGGAFHGSKAAGVWSWPLTCNCYRGQENVDLYTHSPIRLHGVELNYLSTEAISPYIYVTLTFDFDFRLTALFLGDTGDCALRKKVIAKQRKLKFGYGPHSGPDIKTNWPTDRLFLYNLNLNLRDCTANYRPVLSSERAPYMKKKESNCPSKKCKI